jgi:PPK2 family polyphosphate:nucleotide phosphotransferase
MTKLLHTGRYEIKPRQKIDLNEYDPNDTSGFEGKDENEKEESQKLNEKLRDLQGKLYAEHSKKVLVVLQAMDTGGKDGVIHRVFQGVNPQGVRVAHFGVPTAEEKDHDFLWRIHKQVPGNGELVIFNRSHYESVLVERVHNLVPEKVWQRRYQQINDFERLLCEADTTILKFYLHISKDEQKKRLEARLVDPQKNWKFSLADVQERALWDDYQKAYEDALNKCSTEAAPWYIVPADQKWFRDWMVATIIVDKLKSLDPRYPLPKTELTQIRIK